MMVVITAVPKDLNLIKFFLTIPQVLFQIAKTVLETIQGGTSKVLFH